MNAPLTPWQATQARNADARHKADAIEQREVAALEGLYAGKLPEQEPTLRQLAERAIAARKAFCTFDGSDRRDGEMLKWSDLNLADWEATRDFTAALREATGIPTALWRQLWSILP